jgi:hypothetical protein
VFWAAAEAAQVVFEAEQARLAAEQAGVTQRAKDEWCASVAISA